MEKWTFIAPLWFIPMKSCIFKILDKNCFSDRATIRPNFSYAAHSANHLKDKLPFATGSAVRPRASTCRSPSGCNYSEAGAADRNNVCTTVAHGGGVVHRLHRCSGQVEKIPVRSVRSTQSRISQGTERASRRIIAWRTSARDSRRKERAIRRKGGALSAMSVSRWPEKSPPEQGEKHFQRRHILRV